MTYLPAQALTRELINVSQINIEVLDFRSLPYFQMHKTDTITCQQLELVIDFTPGKLCRCAVLTANKFESVFVLSEQACL